MLVECLHAESKQATHPTQPTPKAIQSVAATLKPGTGRILFRDYARGDMAEVTWLVGEFAKQLMLMKKAQLPHCSPG